MSVHPTTSSSVVTLKFRTEMDLRGIMRVIEAMHADDSIGSNAGDVDVIDDAEILSYEIQTGSSTLSMSFEDDDD